MLDRLRRDPGLALVGLALLATTALYIWGLDRGLMNIDDPWLYRDNWILQDASWSSVHTVLFDLHSPRRLTLSPEYLPVRDLSVMLDYVIWGTWYGGFHLTNLLLYLAAIVVWWKAFEAFGVERTVAAVALLLWALHPSHAESVAWLSERKGLLGAMWSGVCALGYARYRAGARVHWLALAVIASVLAVWSKAIAAFAIASIAGLELSLPALRRSWKRSLAGLAAIAVVGILAFFPVVMLATSSHVVGSDVRTPVGRGEMVVGVLGFYLRLGALSLKNAVSYPIGTVGPSPLELALGVLAIVGLAVALALRRVPPVVRAGAAVFAVSWLPVSHLILPLQMVFVADRYLLLPTLGLCLVVAALLSRVATARARVALTAVICLAAGLRTLDAQGSWRDAPSLWARAVESNPSDGEAWSYYAEAVQQQGDPQRAFAIALEGAEHSSSPKLPLRQALLLLGAGQRAEAIEAMRRAATGGEPIAMANLASLLSQDGAQTEALGWARKATTVSPNYANGQRLHGKVALAASLFEEAERAFAAAYELEPTNAMNQYNLGLVLGRLGRTEEAQRRFAECRTAPGPIGDSCKRELRAQ